MSGESSVASNEGLHVIVGRGDASFHEVLDEVDVVGVDHRVEVEGVGHV